MREDGPRERGVSTGNQRRSRTSSDRPFDNVYYGRGYVQLTWLDNYRQMDQRLALGEMLEQDPDKALDPPLAYRIMSIGVREGLFGSQYVQSPPPGQPQRQEDGSWLSHPGAAGRLHHRRAVRLLPRPALREPVRY